MDLVIFLHVSILHLLQYTWIGPLISLYQLPLNLAYEDVGDFSKAFAK